MVRKKQTESRDSTHSVDVAPPAADIPVAQPVDEIEGAPATPAAAEQPKKEWAKRPDPFSILSINWQDGYKVSLVESDSNREIFIKFGNGSKADAPKNFEAIKKMFREEYKMYWDVKVQGWAKELKQGYTPLIREDNGKVRAAVEEAFYKAVELEEQSDRGPSLSEAAKQRSAPAR
jgi:hypothetical protein